MEQQEQSKRQFVYGLVGHYCVVVSFTLQLIYRLTTSLPESHFTTFNTAAPKALEGTYVSEMSNPMFFIG